MSTLRADAFQSSSGTQEVSQTVVYSGTAKAWSNLNGTGTITERDSYNISSYTDNGTGDYTHTINNDMANADYFVGGGTAKYDNTNDGNMVTSLGYSGTLHTAGAVRQRTVDLGAFDRDTSYCGIFAAGDLA